jgi:exodeoxyribonuclease V gamma subunit
MGFILYKSNRLEALVKHLAADALQPPLGSPFAAEQIVVQTQGMAQWLKLELSRRLGITANVEFPFPRAFLSGLIRQVVPEPLQAGAIEPEALTWRIMGRLEPLLAQPAFRELQHYLASSADPRRKFQLAERIAALFDQYSIYRPEFIDDWQNGHETHWQAVLWRATMTDGLACQGKYLYELMQALQSPRLDRRKLPERVCVFAATSLPPVYVRVFEALGRLVPVSLFWLAPCREYWGDITSPREAERLRRRTGDGQFTKEDLHLDQGHPLLAAWGKTGRDFFQLISDVEPVAREVEDFQEPDNSTLLGLVQSAILNLSPADSETTTDAIPPFPSADVPESAGNPPKNLKPVALSDRSVQVHVCHSPLRELQVLRDQLLDDFARDAALSPQDILVMLPDVEAYAPFVKGIFDTAEPGAPAIPYTLSGRGARQESLLVDGFAEFLQLPGRRLTATEVLGFFENAAVRRRFAVTEEELPQVRQWVRRAGIRWGRSAAHREALGLPSFGENTWEHGRDRLLLGYAMADEAVAPVVGLLPCEGIEGTVTDLLGRWLDFLETFFEALDSLAAPRPLAAWAASLQRLLDRMFLPEPGAEMAANAVRRILDSLCQQQAVAGFAEAVPLMVILERLLPALAEPPSGKAVLRGRVTFAGLTALRGVPFRKICILGLQDGTFPRRPAPPSFDLMAQKPRLGDGSRRDDDRYLFLETLISARDSLYLSYVGQSVRDNSARPPSVVVSELLDYLATHFLLGGDAELGNEAHLVTRHRLHAFSPAYFQPDASGETRLFSYSPSQAQLSRLLTATRAGAETFLKMPLAQPGPEWETVALKDLQAFFRNPAKFFVEKRLEFRLPEDDEAMSDDEPFGVEGLDAYQCKQDILDALFTATPRAQLIAQWRGNDALPPGEAGALFANGLFAKTAPLAERVRRRVGQGEGVRVPVDLVLAVRRPGAPAPGPARLRPGRVCAGPEAGAPQAGTIADGGPVNLRLHGELTVFPDFGLVHCRAAKLDPKSKPADHLKLWIEHLALQLTDAPAPRRSYLIGEDGTWIFREVADARELLASLLEHFAAGLLAPLRWFPKASFAFMRGDDKHPPLELAMEAWDGVEGSDFNQGEKHDPYFDLCFRNDPEPLNEAFQALAPLIAGPLLDHQEKEKA